MRSMGGCRGPTMRYVSLCFLLAFGIYVFTYVFIILLCTTVKVALRCCPRSRERYSRCATRAIVESSHHSEAVATNKAAEQVVYAREVLRALGDISEGSTKIATDHQASMLVANDAASAKKARHFLNQYHMLQRRIQMGDIAVVKIPTALMPADFLTKWLPKKKVDLSVRYATNSTAFSA